MKPRWDRFVSDLKDFLSIISVCSHVNLFIHAHTRKCLGLSCLTLSDQLALTSLRYTHLWFFIITSIIQAPLSFFISSFLCYFSVASHAHGFSSCSCLVIVQRTPVAHIHLITFSSVSWLSYHISDDHTAFFCTVAKMGFPFISNWISIYYQLQYYSRSY